MKKLMLSVLALAVLVAAPAFASTFVAMDQASLVAKSDAVVVGEVIQVQSFRDETGAAVVTEAMVKIHEALAGSPESVVVVRTFGGTVDGYTVVAHGFPQFVEGERVVLYLSAAEGESRRVVGYRQGQYRIVRNRLGEHVALPTVEPGVNLVNLNGGAVERPRAVKLDVLREQIQALRSQRIANPLNN